MTRVRECADRGRTAFHRHPSAATSAYSLGTSVRGESVLGTCYASFQTPFPVPPSASKKAASACTSLQQARARTALRKFRVSTDSSLAITAGNPEPALRSAAASEPACKGVRLFFTSEAKRCIFRVLVWGLWLAISSNLSLNPRGALVYALMDPDYSVRQSVSMAPKCLHCRLRKCT